MPSMADARAREVLRLENAGRIDVAPLLPVEVSSLPRGLHARCVAFHPTKPLLAVGVQTCIGGYDLVSGVRQGRVDVRSPPVALMFSNDGSLLVVATAEWHILGINTASWRMRVLAPFNELRAAPLDHILMAITGGSRPLIFFTRIGKPSIRMAVTPGASAEKKSADKKLKWGVKLKLDVSKAVVGLAAHPTHSQLLALYEDGGLRSYVLTSGGLQALWAAPFMLPGEAALVSRLSTAHNPLQALPHPFADGAALLAVGLGSPGLLLLELPAASSAGGEPRVVLRAPMPDHMPVQGVGLLQAHHVLFVFTSSGPHQLRVLAWQLTRTDSTPGLALVPLAVEAPELDAEAVTAAAGSGGKGGGSKALAGAGGGGWQSLWGGDATQEVLTNAAAGSFLLDKLLAPVVQSAVLHPTLGCVAVQRAPPLALRQAPNIMQQRLGLISTPEALISRRTASVPLLRLLRPGMAGAAWPGTRLAAMHTDIGFWQPAAGLGAARLQFPCHLYFLAPGKLCKYSLASKRTGCFVSLPPIDGAGAAHDAKALVHSAKQHAWLVFFERRSAAHSAASRAASPAGGDGGGGGSHFTLVHDAAAVAAATWFLPGKAGVFLGPQDLFFAILGGSGSALSGSGGSSSSSSSADSVVSVYRTTGFKGASLPLYTIQLARPASLGCGLFAGPPGPAAPRVGAEAAARAAQEAADAADKAAKEAAGAAAAAAAAAPEGGAEGGAGAEGAAAAGAAAGAPPFAAAAGAGSSAAAAASSRPHVRRPGETWRPPAAGDGDSDAGGGMMIPVLGIGPAYEGPVGKGLGFKQQQQQRHHRGLAALGFDAEALQGRQEEEAGEPGERHAGGGVVMWHAAGDKLVMAGLPAPGVQYAAGNDSDDPDAPEPPAAAGAAAAAAPDMGQVYAEHCLQLLPLERVITVAWQRTVQGVPLEPHQAAAAILTTQRLLLVSGDLAVLAAIDASCGSVGLASGITSLLWVGPALLFMTAAGQVMQLTWTGQTQHVASVSSQPLPLLAGALADSLLLIRHSSATGEPEVTSRAVGILQPLVIGWTSLASSGLLPKGLNTSRAALQALLEAFDTTSVTSGMLWSLIQGWCADVAAALATHATDVEPSVQLAANAAAGRWSAVVSALRGEHDRSMYYPAPAPPGSQLHHKLLAGAAGAIMHGQFSAAQELLELAGEWETLMAVCVCSGDFAALRNLAAGLQSGVATAAGGQQEASDIARLARALVAAYTNTGRTFGANRLLGGGNNWRLRVMMSDDSFFSNAADWNFGGTGKQPAMETSSFNAPAAFIQDGDVGPLPRADAATLGAYLGNADLAALGDASASALEAAAAATGAGGGAGGLGGPAAAGVTGLGSGEADFLANLDNLVAMSSRAGDGNKPGIRRSASAASSLDSDLVSGETGAGAATGARGAQRDPFAVSDEEEDASSFGYKFRIHIKESDNPAAAGATGASTADLRAAASKLKLGAPGTPLSTSGSFREQLGRQGSSGSLGARAGQGSDDPYDLSFLSAPLAQPGSAQPPQQQQQPSPGRLPPRAPSASGGGGARAAQQRQQESDSFDAIGQLTGLRASEPGLGGPAMRARPQPQQAPIISDDDFFAALAPAITGGAGTAQPAAGRTTAGGLAPQRPQQQSLQLPQAQQQAPGAAASGVEDFFADFSGTTSSTTPVPAAPRPPAAAPAAAAAAAAAGPTGGADATALYLRGVAAMEAASWGPAADAFAAALGALAAEAPSSSRSERQAFAAQYLAAVLLLQAASTPGVSTATSARLYRYATGLKLDDRHKVALSKEAVIRNKLAGNFRYAADQLTWLVTFSLGSAPVAVMARLQEDIDECDRKGGRNASIESDENVADWVSLVAAGASKQDVDEVVLPLLAQA